jgi:DNA-binding winged helix-turn-helix (wHTH) protein
MNTPVIGRSFSLFGLPSAIHRRPSAIHRLWSGSSSFIRLARAMKLCTPLMEAAMIPTISPPAPYRQAGTYEFDGFVLDTRLRGVRQPDGTPMRLTPRMFRTLLLFVEHPGELLGKEWLMARLWPGMDVGENSLSRIVCNLRQALSCDGRHYIQTESRYGFRFVCPVIASNGGSNPLETLTLILAMQEIVTRHLAEVLAPHRSHAAQHQAAGLTLDESGGHAPSPIPAFPM